MHYEYDYGFIARWMKEFRKKQKDLLAAVDIQNYNMTRKWLSGEMMLGTESILKFCNSTGLSPAEFFKEDGHALTLKPLEEIVATTNEPQDVTAIKLDAEREKNKLIIRYREREDRIRSEYEEKLRRLLQLIDKLQKEGPSGMAADPLLPPEPDQ